jgi:hypothetical protein
MTRRGLFRRSPVLVPAAAKVAYRACVVLYLEHKPEPNQKEQENFR